jgi:syntaxin 1B/2/3
MSNMNGNDPNRLLNECRSIDRSIDDLEQDLERLKLMHRRAADDTQVGSDSSLQNQVNALGDDIISKYRALGNRVKRIKQDPESGNPRNAPQVGKIDRRIKTMINKYQQADSDYRKRLQERSAREYRIVRPDASDAEVREATEDTNQQIFSQAVCIPSASP